MKKGFTLIELIGVICVLAVITLITVPIVTDSIKKSKRRAYEIQINTIIESAKKWGIENASQLPDVDYTIYVSIPQLIHEGYISPTENGYIKDPRDSKKNIEGCVAITYSESYNQYDYTYGSYCPS